MDDIQTLITRLTARNDDSRHAAAQLVLSGAEAVAPISHALGTASLGGVALLAHTLSRIRAPEALAELKPFAYESDHRVAPAAIAAIGYSLNPEAIDVLANLLRAPSPYHDRVVQALGELGQARGIAILNQEASKLMPSAQDPACIDALIAQAKHDRDPSVLSYLTAVAVALAKLGDHELTKPILALSRYDRLAQADDESDPIRINAMQGLRYLVGPGVFTALLEALGDPAREVQESAMRAMLLLGTKQSVTAWLDLVRVRAPLAALAYSMIHEVVGEWPTGNQFIENLDDSQLLPWWAILESKLLAGTVYRFGRRAWPPDLFPRLDSQSLSIINDLRVITGIDFALHVDPRLEIDGAPDPALRTAKAWWDANGHRFDHGDLYKYGHRQDLSLVFESEPDQG